MREITGRLPLLFIPVFLGMVSIILREAQGDYFLSHNSDPAYLYLVNSANVATLQPVRHVDNPGTTVQVIGGLVIKVISIFRGTGDIEAEVFRNPEYYLNAINIVLLVLNIAAVAALGLFAFYFTNSIWLSLLLQCSPLGSWLLVKAYTMVSPEPVSVLTSVFFIILLVWTAEKEIHLRKPGMFAILFSIVTAFGLATKLTFIPLVLIPVIIIPGWKWKTIFLFSTVACFHIFLIPAFKHYDFLLEWAQLMLLHSGQYGQGAPQIVDIKSAAGNLLKLIVLEHPFYIVLFFSIGLLFFIFVNRTLKEGIGRHYCVKLLIAVTLSAIFHTMLAAKNYNPRYLLPSLMLLMTAIYLNLKVIALIRNFHPQQFQITAKAKAVMIILLFILFLARNFSGYFPGDTLEDWKNQIWNYSFLDFFSAGSLYFLFFFILLALAAIIYTKRQKKSTRDALSVCLISVLAAYQFRHIDIIGFSSHSKKAKLESLSVQDFVTRKYSGYAKVYGERSSSPYYALKYGTNVNFTNQRQLEQLKEIYPLPQIFFWGLKLGDRQFESWTEKTSLREILQQNSKVIFTSDARNLTEENIRAIEAAEKVRLTNVFKGKREVVYLVEAL